MNDAQQRHTNRLANETSPYLLQHAHNPVDWYPWGPEALSRAQVEQRPIFLSIGYAACHWCHVMERESFEDERTAALLNRSFVPIKVDREERPDLDAVYMDAVQQMTGQGGWPMSVFLTPSGSPFYGGTYFPNQRRHGLPSFTDVLDAVARAWDTDRSSVEAAGQRLAEGIAAGASLRAQPQLPQPWALQAAVAELERGFDARTGGWGGAPKFPQPMTLEFLLRQHARDGESSPERGSEGSSLAMARRSLDAMAAGGIYDHLAGGFARYATDSQWLVPHFEKMLYDNAQLCRVYVHAWQLTGEPRYRQVATDTLDFVARELREPANGAFSASLDADTDGHEGLTYVWSASEVRESLGDASPLFEAAYGVSVAGNWEGHTILSRVRTAADLASQFGLEASVVERTLAKSRRQLLERRSERPQPNRDGKVIAAWNGLMVAAFADAGQAFREPTYLAVAREAGGFLLDQLMQEDGRLRRSWTSGRVAHEAVLEDYTHLADGLLALYGATFDERWFLAARSMADFVLLHFRDPAGGFFDTADDAEALVARPKGLQDNALPSGNAMAVVVLLQLAALTGEGAYRDAAEDSLSLVAPVMHRYPTAFAQWLIAADLSIGPLYEIAIVGEPGDPSTGALLAGARGGYRPRHVVAVSANPHESAVPLLHGRARKEGLPTAYVCQEFSCRQPVTDAAVLAEQLSPSPASATGPATAHLR